MPLCFVKESYILFDADHITFSKKGKKINASQVLEETEGMNRQTKIIYWAGKLCSIILQLWIGVIPHHVICEPLVIMR